MRNTVILGTVFSLVLILVMPFVGGAGPSIIDPARAAEASADRPIAASDPVGTSAIAPDAAAAAAAVSARAVSVIQKPQAATAIPDTEHLAQKPVPKPVVVAPSVASKGGAASRDGGTAVRRQARAAGGQSCPSGGGGGGSAPGVSDPLGQGMIAGTTTSDIQSFSAAYNAIRVANCLQPVPSGNFRYSSCMEQRLFWMAEDPSTDPGSAWGHAGSQRSDGVPSRGCDGNLAGGSGNSGATVAQKWWDSTPHRLSLYRPSYSGGTDGVCVYFAMSHGGVPNEPSSFTRAAATWGGC